MAIVGSDTQAIIDQMAAANAANAPGSASGAPTGESAAAAQPAQVPNTSASDSVGNLPLTPRPGGVSPSLSTSMAQTLNQMPVDSSAKPGTWAKQLLGAAFSAISKRDGSDGSGNPGGAAGVVRGIAGGLSNALANANPGPVPPGAGWLYGAEKAAGAAQAQARQNKQEADKLAQQKIENQNAEARLSIEQQNSANESARTKATIAEANIAMHHTAVLTRDATLEEQRQEEKWGAEQAAPYVEMGAKKLYDHLDSDALSDKIKSGELSATKQLSFVDGHVEAKDAQGNPIIDEETGLPKLRATFTVLDNVPAVKLTQQNVDLLNKYGLGISGPPLVAGQEMDGATAYRQLKLAGQQRAVLLGAEDKISEIHNRESEMWDRDLSAQEKKQKLEASHTITPYLVQAGGDPVLAMQNMANSKDKDKVGLFGIVYGPGTLEKYRSDEINGSNKAITDGVTETAKINKQIADAQTSLIVPRPGKPLTPDQVNQNAETQKQLQDLRNSLAGVTQDTTNAKVKRNLYLGLPARVPDAFATAVQKLDEIPAEQRGEIITAIPDANDAEKIFLLQHYGIPVPPALMPKPAVQPGQGQPAQQAQPQPQVARPIAGQPVLPPAQAAQ